MLSMVRLESVQPPVWVMMVTLGEDCHGSQEFNTSGVYHLEQYMPSHHICMIDTCMT